MLQFWRKSNQKEKGEDSCGTSPNLTNANVLTDNLNLDIDIDDLYNSLSHSLPLDKYSRLSKPLVEVIRDNEAIGYFIQYLEAMNVSNLAKCLLDIDNFNASLIAKSNLVPWTSVKGVRKVVDNDSGRITWDFLNGIGYTTNTACDISSHCSLEKRSSDGKMVSVSGRTSVRATPDTKLTEMQGIEEELLSVLLNADTVSEVTVDALRIFYKYFSHSAPYKIILSTSVFQKLVNNFRTNIDKDTFLDVRNLLFTVLENEYFNVYLRSDCHCKYQISILTGSEVLISDIVYNESALFYFMEFLESEGCQGMLEFWMAANNFREQYVTEGHCYDPVQAQNDAMVLYVKYFSLQASHPLHLGDKVRFLVEESICREEGPLPTCFEPVQSLIVRILQRRYLAPFLQSQLYFKFLSELISTVNAGPSKSGGSDCSSDVSISIANTLLVSEGGSHEKGDPRSWNSSDLRIDSRQLYDPDSLWRRRRQAGLSLGRVNALGRFQTDLEPEPDRKIGLESRITKAMKRLVNLEEDKSKEEMAWQVAEMIVKDVTSLTMPSTDQ